MNYESVSSIYLRKKIYTTREILICNSVTDFFFFNKGGEEDKEKMNVCKTTSKLHEGYFFSC